MTMKAQWILTQCVVIIIIVIIIIDYYCERLLCVLDIGIGIDGQLLLY